MNGRTLKIGILIFIVLFGIITSIHPIYPDEQYLQHFGTILILLIPLADLKSNRLSLVSFVCVSIFIVLHIIGARYIYSYVPYNEWLKDTFHVDLNSIFHTSRNHYDRFVHLVFGVVAFPYLIEVLGNKPNLKKAIRILIVWSFIQTMSMVYEVFEWFLTIILSPEAADNYNGQQGDAWDAQKDMFFAMVGSSVMAIIYLIRKNKK
jgi:putative membrane protein